MLFWFSPMKGGEMEGWFQLWGHIAHSVILQSTPLNMFRTLHLLNFSLFEFLFQSQERVKAENWFLWINWPWNYSYQSKVKTNFHLCKPILMSKGVYLVSTVIKLWATSSAAYTRKWFFSNWMEFIFSLYNYVHK